MIRLFRVRGRSMLPTLRPGDLLVLRRRQPRTDDLVVVGHPRLGTVVKRLGADGRLVGDGVESSSTHELGKLSNAALIGVAVLVITPSGLRRPKALASRRSGNRA